MAKKYTKEQINKMQCDNYYQQKTLESIMGVLIGKKNSFRKLQEGTKEKIAFDVGLTE